MQKCYVGRDVIWVGLIQPNPEVLNKIVTRKGCLNYDPLKINMQLKINSQVVNLEKLS
jgi:hypothetical protein